MMSFSLVGAPSMHLDSEAIEFAPFQDPQYYHNGVSKALATRQQGSYFAPDSLQPTAATPVHAFPDPFENEDLAWKEGQKDPPHSMAPAAPTKYSATIQGAENSKAVSKKPCKSSRKNKSKKKKKGKDKPTRALSAYNLFFRDYRQKLLDELPVRPQGKPRRSHGKLGFQDMARIIGSQWNARDEATKTYYETLALEEKKRFETETLEQNAKRQARNIAANTTAGPPTVVIVNHAAPAVNHEHFPVTLVDPTATITGNRICMTNATTTMGMPGFTTGEQHHHGYSHIHDETNIIASRATPTRFRQSMGSSCNVMAFDSEDQKHGCHQDPEDVAYLAQKLDKDMIDLLIRAFR